MQNFFFRPTHFSGALVVTALFPAPLIEIVVVDAGVVVVGMVDLVVDEGAVTTVVPGAASVRAWQKLCFLFHSQTSEKRWLQTFLFSPTHTSEEVVVGTGFRPASGYIVAGSVAVVTTLVLWGIADFDVEAVVVVELCV